jgi:hypothetical protein
MSFNDGERTLDDHAHQRTHDKFEGFRRQRVKPDAGKLSGAIETMLLWHLQ